MIRASAGAPHFTALLHNNVHDWIICFDLDSVSSEWNVTVECYLTLNICGFTLNLLSASSPLPLPRALCQLWRERGG